MFNQPIPPITKNLLIINGLLYLAKFVFESYGIDLDVYLAAFYPQSANFHGWQIVSHMFMHANLPHILFNMFALWMFGSAVEMTIGPKRFLILYFAAGLGSFVLFNFTNYLQVEQLIPVVEGLGIDLQQIYDAKNPITPGMRLAFPENAPEAAQNLLSYFTTPMMGASGAIYGILVAFGVLYPNTKLMLIFLPIPIKAKYFIPVMIAIEFYLGLENFAWNPIAHFAHIGGAIIGFILIWNWKKQLKKGR